MANDFETQLLDLLAKRFTRPDDPGLLERRAKLRELFSGLKDPATARAYYGRLATTNPADKLSREFHYRLAAATCEELLRILRQNGNDQARATPKTEPTYRLLDEAARTERRIAWDDPEFKKRFVDYNIVAVTSDPDQATASHHTMVVQYEDGRELSIPLSRIPIRWKILGTPGQRFARVRFSVPMMDHLVLRDGFILPVDHLGDALFNDSVTPNLIDFRTTIELNIILRRQRLEIAELCATFSGLIGVSAGGLAFGMSVVQTSGGGFRVRPRAVPGRRPQRPGIPPERFQFPNRQVKKVTAQEMFTWEKQGGHTLAKHSPQQTRKTLLSRVIGETQIPAPKMQPGGQKAPDLRVWQGERSSAASAWKDQATMHKAISTLIEQHLPEIRTVTARGGDFVLERHSLGYRTGEGWVKTAGSSAERGVFWDNDLRGATLVVKPRPGHVPSAADPEGWYLHTAYPDRAP